MLPAGSLGYLLDGGAFGPLHQVDHLGVLGAGAGFGLGRRLGLVLKFGEEFGRGHSAIGQAIRRLEDVAQAEAEGLGAFLDRL